MIANTSTLPATSPLSKDPVVVPNGTDEVRCDGGHPSLGHPAVFYSFDGKDTVECLYCGRKYTKG